MPEIPSPILRREDRLLRAFAIMAAGILLNLGLFFVLGIWTPIFVGLIVGYIIGERGIGLLAGTLSSFFAYSIIIPVTSGESDLLSIVIAVMIMILIGTVGSYFGYYLRTKATDSID